MPTLEQPQATAPQTLHAATVFIIDDDAGASQVTATLLSRDGFHTRPFTSAIAFLSSLPVDPLMPRCLISDVRMPDMDGLQLQKVLAERKMRMPTIFMTGYPEIPSAVRAMQIGAVDYLPKPVDVDRLRACVAKAIERDLVYCEKLLARRKIETRLTTLTSREREVFDLLVSAHSSKEIAKTLAISVKTVFVHRARVLEKMGVDNLVALSKLAFE